MTYSMGVFVAPLEAEFGWSRSTIVSALGINSLIAAILAPFVGALVDRFGPRRLAIIGISSFCAAFALLSTVSSSPLHWWALWVIVGLATVMITPMVWTFAIISRFSHTRGLALAVTLSGTAITAVLAPVLGNFLIQSGGWRLAYIGLGALYCAFALPLVLLFFFSAFEQPRGDAPVAIDKPTSPPLTGMTVSQGLRSGAFWKIGVATFFVLIPITGTIVHLVPALTLAGLDRSGAVTAASLVGFAAVAGRLLAGYLLDRANARLLATIAFALPAIVCAALLNFEGGFALALAIALLFGLCTGAEMEMASYLSSRHFGMRNFGTLFGFIVSGITLAAGLAPILAGLVFDAQGSYRLALIGGAALAIAASLLIFSLPEYSAFKEERA